MPWLNRQRALRRMAALPAVIKGEVRVAIQNSRLELEDAIRGAAPEDDGDLKRSVRSEDTSDATRISAEVSAGDDKAFYARMVEFGTPKQGAQPFFYPIVRVYRRRIRARISRAIKKGAKRALSGG